MYETISCLSIDIVVIISNSDFTLSMEVFLI